MIKNLPLVSIIVTTKNRLNLLKETIESIKNQTYSNTELIIVDDGSTDGTKEFFQSSNELIYIYIEPKNSKGGNYARNIGIKKSKGEFIAFCDDDDIWHPTKIEKQLQVISSNPNIGLVYCGLIYHLISKDKDLSIYKYPNKHIQGDISKKVLYTIPCVTSTILTKRSILEQVGLFDENLRFWQEYELTIRIAQISEIRFINECLITYLSDHRDTNRLTNKYTPWLESVKYIKNKHRSLYQKQSLVEKWMSKLLFYRDAANRIKSQNKKNIRVSFLTFFYFLLCIPYKIFLRLK